MVISKKSLPNTSTSRINRFTLNNSRKYHFEKPEMKECLSKNGFRQQKAIIVIPIYKARFECFETISLRQGFKVLKNYRFAFILPEKFRDDQELRNTLNSLGADKLSVSFLYFKDQSFSSLMSYNTLLVTREFYECFAEYDYMLIYQTDAFVFRDVLQTFMEKNIDYIGAPWFEGYNNAHENSKLLEFHGNGGFSLRKIRSFLDVLDNKNKNKKVRSMADIYSPYENRSVLQKISRFPKICYQYLFNNTVRRAGKIKHFFEDVFWAKYAPRINPSFKTAGFDDAIEFSFEVNPKVLYTMNSNRLPFGCHAWWRYDLNFWKPYIEAQGYKVDPNCNAEIA
jgi:hypothetical protein